jgi:hypothetical protein
MIKRESAAAPAEKFSEVKEQDPYEEYDTLYKKYEQAVKEKEDATRELQRLKDA